MDLKNKVAVITGASDGIGKETALRLAKEGTNLLLLGRDKNKLEKVKDLCIKTGAKNVDIYPFDLSDKNTVTDYLEKIRKNHTDISIILNIAGIWQKLGDLDLLNHSQIDDIINTNLTGLIKLTNTLLPTLRKQKESAIINVSSRSGYSAQTGQSVYTASKYGVRGFTEVLYEDLKNTNIRVAGVYQGGTATQMFNKAGENWSNEKLSSFIPPSEIAEIIVFMLTRTDRVWLPEIRIESK